MQIPAHQASSADRFERPVVSSDLYESPRNRWVAAIKRGLVILVAAALVTAAFGLLGYRPLSGAPAGSVTGLTVTEDDARYVVAYQPDASFEYSFSVRNDGRWGVTVIGMERPVHGAFANSEIFVTPPGATSAIPDGSAALGAGETATFTVRATFAACATPPPTGARAAWNADVIRFRVMGVDRAMQVDLPYSIVIDDAAAPRC